MPFAILATRFSFQQPLIAAIHPNSPQRRGDQNAQNCYGEHDLSAGEAHGHWDGADDFILKPWDNEVLLEKIQQNSFSFAVRLVPATQRVTPRVRISRAAKIIARAAGPAFKV